MDLPSSSSASPGWSQQNKPDNNHDAIKNWTLEEKFHLKEALMKYGHQDFKKIQEHVITKNLKETKAAVDYFTSFAHHHPILKKPEGHKEQNKPKPKPKSKPSAPLSEWATLLTDNLPLSELQTEAATAVRMIADLEKIPDPELTEGIDFRQVYHQIANAMEGKPVTADPATCAVLHKCLIETELASKAFIKTATKRNILNNIDVSNKEMNMFPGPTDNKELAIVRYLASQRNYNPLKIPEDNLQPSTSLNVKPFPP